MTARLLVSGIGKRNHLLGILVDECARLDVELIGADASDLPPARASVNIFEKLPLARDGGFANAYLDVVARRDVTACLSLVDPEIPVLGHMVDVGLLPGINLLHPPAASSALCEDKLLFAAHLEDCGVPAVPTFEEPPAAAPFIVKDRRGSAASGFRVFESKVEVENPAHRLVFQPYLRGRHFCVDAHFDSAEGKLVDFAAKEVLAKSQGETYLLRSVEAQRFVDVLEAVAGAIRLEGIVNLDIYEHDGMLVVMEVNCRIGGNYPAAHALGVNLVRRALVEAFEPARSEPGEPNDPLVSTLTPYPLDMLVAKYFSFTDPFPSPPHPGPTQGCS